MTSPRRSALTLALAAVVSCGPSVGPLASLPSASPTRTIKIVSSLPLTGTSRAFSLGMVDGITMALDEAGRRVGSFAIEYESLDDATAARQRWDPDQEAANALRAVADPTVVAYIGTADSGAARVSIPILCTAGLVMVSPSNTHPGLTRPFIEGEPEKYYPNGCGRNYARVIPADDVQGAAAASWARDLGARSVFVAADTAPYGKALAAAFRARAKEIGLQEAGFESAAGLAASPALIALISASGADTLYYSPNTQGSAVPFVTQVRAALPTLRIVASDLLYSDDFLKGAGAAAEGLRVTNAGPPPERYTGAQKDWLERYRQRYGDRAPGLYAIYGYEAARAVLAALARSGGAAGDRATVRANVMGTRDFDGALGRWSFDANGDTTLTLFSGLQARNGKFEFEKELR